MIKSLYALMIVCVVYNSSYSQENGKNMGLKVGLGGSGISISENSVYSPGTSFMIGGYRDWPINKENSWYFNCESWFNIAPVELPSEKLLINYNLILPFGLKYNSGKDFSISFGLAPTFTFATQAKSEINYYNLPNYHLNSQNILFKNEFITSPVTVQFRLGGHFSLNETLMLGIEFMKYFGGKTYYNTTYSSFDKIELNYSTLMFCLIKKLPL